MLIDWSQEFDHYLTRLERDAQNDDDAHARLRLLLTQLAILQDLDDAPDHDTPTIKRVRQSRTYPIWRISHPYRDGIAMRLIVWFPTTDHVVVALFAADKARMGDVFYNSVGTRADTAIETWKQQTRGES